MFLIPRNFTSLIRNKGEEPQIIYYLYAYLILLHQWFIHRSHTRMMNKLSRARRKVWWLCEQGHKWQAVIGSRSRGRGCPYCYRENRSRPRIQTLIQTGKKRKVD